MANVRHLASLLARLLVQLEIRAAKIRIISNYLDEGFGSRLVSRIGKDSLGVSPLRHPLVMFEWRIP